MADRDWLVMVVDDDDTFREEIREMLVACGHRVVDAANGLEAVALLEEVTPDLVITDVHMPEMDGVEIVLRLRKSCPEVPVIAISGGDAWGYMGNLHATLRLGAIRALPKPLNIAKLLRTASELIEQRTKA